MKFAPLVVGVVAAMLLGASLIKPSPTAHAQGTPTDPRFVLQTQSGLAAYAQITGTLTTGYVAPLFTAILQQNDDWILGNYQPTGRPAEETTRLLIHKQGWAVSYFPPVVHVGYLVDMRLLNLATPGMLTNGLERTITEVAAALNVTNTTASYYDFYRPTQTGLTLFWNVNTQGSADKTESLTLPLANTYSERGYGFGTAYTNSEMYLNTELIRSVGSLSAPLYYFGTLTSTQLRGGQANALRLKNFSIFGNGFAAGVAVEYSGNTPLTKTGGYQRDMVLAYPPFLGVPLTIYQINLPLVRK